MDRKKILVIAAVALAVILFVPDALKKVGEMLPGGATTPSGMHRTVPLPPGLVGELERRGQLQWGGMIPESLRGLLSEYGVTIPPGMAAYFPKSPADNAAALAAQAALTPTVAPSATPTRTPTLLPPAQIPVTTTVAVVPERLVPYGLDVSSRVEGQIQAEALPSYPFVGYRLWFGRDCPLVPEIGCRNQELFAAFSVTQTVFLAMEGVTGTNVLFQGGTAKFVSGQVITATNTLTVGEVVTATLAPSQATMITTVGQRFVGKNGPPVPAIVVAVLRVYNATTRINVQVVDLWYVVPQGDGGQIFKAIPSLAPAAIAPAPTATATPPSAQKTPTRNPTVRR